MQKAMRESLIFPRLLASGIRSPLRVNGLEAFTRSLERLFYSSARVACTSLEGSSAGLALSLECPLGFREVLDAFGNGLWGHQRIEAGKGSGVQNLSSFLGELEHGSGLTLVIEELSLQCTDTRLVLQQEAKGRGIHEDFYSLMHLLGLQYARLSDSPGGRPSEIYAPVLLAGPDHRPEQAGDPLRYWAVYFESREEPLIFDSWRMQPLEGDLSLGLG